MVSFLNDVLVSSLEYLMAVGFKYFDSSGLVITILKISAVVFTLLSSEEKKVVMLIAFLGIEKVSNNSSTSEIVISAPLTPKLSALKGIASAFVISLLY